MTNSSLYFDFSNLKGMDQFLFIYLFIYFIYLIFYFMLFFGDVCVRGGGGGGATTKTF